MNRLALHRACYSPHTYAWVRLSLRFVSTAAGDSFQFHVDGMMNAVRAGKVPSSGTFAQFFELCNRQRSLDSAELVLRELDEGMLVNVPPDVLSKLLARAQFAGNMQRGRFLIDTIIRRCKGETSLADVKAFFALAAATNRLEDALPVLTSLAVHGANHFDTFVSMISQKVSTQDAVALTSLLLSQVDDSAIGQSIVRGAAEATPIEIKDAAFDWLMNGTTDFTQASEYVNEYIEACTAALPVDAVVARVMRIDPSFWSGASNDGLCSLLYALIQEARTCKRPEDRRELLNTATSLLVTAAQSCTSEHALGLLPRVWNLLCRALDKSRSPDTLVHAVHKLMHVSPTFVSAAAGHALLRHCTTAYGTAQQPVPRPGQQHNYQPASASASNSTSSPSGIAPATASLSPFELFHALVGSDWPVIEHYLGVMDAQLAQSTEQHFTPEQVAASGTSSKAKPATKSPLEYSARDYDGSELLARSTGSFPGDTAGTAQSRMPGSRGGVDTSSASTAQRSDFASPQVLEVGVETYNMMLDYALKRQLWKEFEQVMASLEGMEVEEDAFTQSLIVQRGIAQADSLHDLHAVQRRLVVQRPLSIVPFNQLMVGFFDQGRPGNAVHTLADAIAAGLTPDPVTLQILLKGFASLPHQPVQGPQQARQWSMLHLPAVLSIILPAIVQPTEMRRAAEHTVTWVARNIGATNAATLVRFMRHFDVFDSSLGPQAMANTVCPSIHLINLRGYSLATSTVYLYSFLSDLVLQVVDEHRAHKTDAMTRVAAAPQQRHASRLNLKLGRSPSNVKAKPGKGRRRGGGTPPAPARHNRELSASAGSGSGISVLGGRDLHIMVGNERNKLSSHIRQCLGSELVVDLQPEQTFRTLCIPNQVLRDWMFGVLKTVGVQKQPRLQEWSWPVFNPAQDEAIDTRSLPLQHDPEAARQAELRWLAEACELHMEQAALDPDDTKADSGHPSDSEQLSEPSNLHSIDEKHDSELGDIAPGGLSRTVPCTDSDMSLLNPEAFGCNDGLLMAPSFNLRTSLAPPLVVVKNCSSPLQI